MVLGHIAHREKDNGEEEKWLITPTSIKLKDECGEMRSSYNFSKKFYIMAYQKIVKLSGTSSFCIFGFPFCSEHNVQLIWRPE